MTEVFLKLLNMSITASYLIIAIAVIRLVFRKAPKWIFCLLWCLVGIRLLCPVSLESPFSLVPGTEPVNVKSIVGQEAAVQTEGEALQGEVAVGATDSADINSKLAVGTQQMENASGNISGSTGEVGGDGAFSVVGSTVEGILSMRPGKQEAFSVADWMAGTWLVGMTLLLGYTIITYIRLKCRVSDAVRLQENIYQSEKVTSPFVFGMIEPKIYLPYSLTEESRMCVIAHEQAHIKRCDHWVKPIGFVVLSVYWFHPLIWVAYTLLCRDMELACDEKVLRELGEDKRKSYSTALLDCSIASRSIAACPLAFGEVGIGTRIKNVLHYKKPAVWTLVICGVLCVAVAVCFLTNPVNKDPIILPYISDEATDWENIEKILIYADGYYGRTLDEPLVIVDEETIDELVSLALETGKYEPAEERLEGVNDLFVNFGNGVVLCMYKDVNYGSISPKLSSYTKTHYYLPKKFCNMVKKLLEENKPLVNGYLMPDGRIYEYCLKLSGTMPNAKTGSTFIVYTNHADLTFEEVWMRLLSSVHDPEAKDFYLAEIRSSDEEIVGSDADGLPESPDVEAVEEDAVQPSAGSGAEPFAGAVSEPLGDSDTGLQSDSAQSDAIKSTVLKIGELSELEVNNLEGVTMSLDDLFMEGDSVTKELLLTGAAISITNNTDMNIQYGSDFYLQVEMGGEYYYLEPIPENLAFTQEAYPVGKGQTRTETINWTVVYGGLPKGRYRLVKSIMDFRGSGDFTKYYLAVDFAIVDLD